MARATLHAAAECGDVKEVRRLLKNKQCDVNEEFGIGWTPLCCATLNNHVEIAEILVNHNADVNKGSILPLHAAVLFSVIGSVKWLLEHGADPNKQGWFFGDNVLHRAAAKNETEIVKLLLTYGADPNIKSNNGKTVFDCVSDKDSTVYQLLIKYSQNARTTLEAGIGDGMNAYFRRGCIADSEPVYLSCKVTPGQDNTMTKVENIQISGTVLSQITAQDDSCTPLPGYFLKERDDSEYAAFLQSLGGAVNCVGQVCSPAVSGSGFRVGICYVMTNYHVVQGIMGVPYGRLPQLADKIKLTQPGVYVAFDFNQPHAQHGPVQSYSLDCANPLIWYDINLDVAVIKLAVPPGGILPPALLQFVNISSACKDTWILGHPSGGPKRFEKCELTSDGQIVSAQTWSTLNSQPNLYAACSDPRFLTYNAAFEHGASGSPCLIPGPFNVAAVAAVHTRGVPQLNSRAGIPRDKTFEQGVRVTSICKAMRQTNLLLCKEIFGDHYVSLAVAAP